ncbi:MAG: hypothetical protein U9R34_06345 [Nanoarchaeota archaeon]|nr:hypothetical protein [Nanoarchaeota archaeon]
MIMKSKTRITGKTMIIIIISILLILSLCLSGCKSKQQENTLAGETIQVSESKPIQPAVKDTSVSPSKQAFDLAVNEPDLNKAVELCKALEVKIRKDWCFIEIAKKTNSASAAISICSNIANDAHKSDCIKESASRFQDSSLCNTISDSYLKSLCIAEAKGNCDLIEDEQDKELCMKNQDIL